MTAWRRFGCLGDAGESWPLREGDGDPDKRKLPGFGKVADVTFNGAPMGSELRLQPGADRHLRVRIRGTAPLECVQVIHCGHLLAELPVAADSPDLDAEWVDERPGRPLEDVYYYVRARQHDGECLWTSPFWIDLPEE